MEALDHARYLTAHLHGSDRIDRARRRHSRDDQPALDLGGSIPNRRLALTAKDDVPADRDRDGQDADNPNGLAHGHHSTWFATDRASKDQEWEVTNPTHDDGETSGSCERRRVLEQLDVWWRLLRDADAVLEEVERGLG